MASGTGEVELAGAQRRGAPPAAPPALTVCLKVVVVVVMRCISMVCFSLSLTRRKVLASSEALGAWKCSMWGLSWQNLCQREGTQGFYRYILSKPA